MSIRLNIALRRAALSAGLFTLAAAARAAEEAGAEGGGGGLLGTLGIDWRTVLGQLFAFAILYWLFMKYLWGPIQGILQGRQEEVSETYREAENARAAADSARRDYEARLAQADEESRQRIAEALAEAARMKDEIIADARRQSERIIASGRENVRMEVEKAQVEIREASTRMAVDLAGRIIQQNITAESQRTLIDRFIEGVGNSQ